NDLIAHGQPLNYSTGLSGTDQHGFTAGQTVTFAVRNQDGSIVREVNYTVGSGTSIASMRADLDAALQGYGKTTMDATGRISLVSTNNDIGSIDVIADTTSRGDTNLSMSQLFGWGETLPAERARSLQIRSDIRANPGLLGTAQADLAGAAAGQRVL